MHKSGEFRLFKRRWYDRSEQTQNAMGLLKELDAKSQEIISNNIVDIANSIKTVRKEEEVVPLSIGLKRVLGLYKSSESKRWYDKSEHLDQAFKTISTLPEDDFENIMEGICSSLKN